MPDISVSLDIEVVKIVCVLHLATVWTLQSLDNLSFHHSGNVSWQQRQQETFLMAVIQRQKKKKRFKDGQEKKLIIVIHIRFHIRKYIILIQQCLKFVS